MKNPIILLLLLTIPYSSFVLANEKGPSIGRVIKLLGNAVIGQKSSQARPVKLGDHLHINDTIFTLKNSVCKIILKDSTVFFIGPKSKLTLDEFLLNSSKERKASYSIGHGSIRAIFSSHYKSTTNSPSIKISTPNAAIGVRGTELILNISQLKTGDFKTEVFLLSGQADIQTHEIDTKFGEALVMAPGQKFSTSQMKQLLSTGQKHFQIEQFLTLVPKYQLQELTDKINPTLFVPINTDQKDQEATDRLIGKELRNVGISLDLNELKSDGPETIKRGMIENIDKKPSMDRRHPNHQMQKKLRTNDKIDHQQIKKPALDRPILNKPVDQNTNTEISPPPVKK